MKQLDIFIKAKPGANIQSIKQIDQTHFVVAVTEPPVRGLANDAIIKALAEHFDVPRSCITIRSGLTSRHKRVRIEGKNATLI